jgi:cytosine/adenosine deaminase-related metal-dependent hydrolase
MQPQPAIIHQARWVITMEGPVLENGAVAVTADQIIDVGPAAAVRRNCRVNSLRTDELVHYDHGDGVIIPALINTHLHLEFTALRGAVPPQPDLPAWLQKTLAAMARLSSAEIDGGIREGIAELRRFGTILGAEISNTGRSLPFLTASGLAFHYFYECLGFDLLTETPLAEDFPFLAQPSSRSIPMSAAAHAPYSVSAPLFRRIKSWNRGLKRPTSVHLAESREEIHFLLHGIGSFQELLARRGRWYEGFTPPGCSPVVYLDQLGFWDKQTLAVHGVWLEAQDREILARRGVWLALCPRSNLHTGAGLPDLVSLHRAGLELTLGTDSLASSPDLNLFQDIRVLKNHFPEVHFSDLLAMATINGAAALNRAHDLGSIKPGKKAALLFLPISPGVPLWPELVESGVQGRIYRLTHKGKEFSDGA